MKGIQVMTLAIVCILLAIAVILVGIVMVGGSQQSVSNIMIRSDLFNCCGYRDNWDCSQLTESQVNCKVSWKNTTVPLDQLASQANVTDLQTFCHC